MIPLPLLSAARPSAQPRHRLRAGLTLLALALLVLPITSGCSKEASSQKTAASDSASDPVVARVNGTEIHESDLALAAQDIGEQLQQIPPPQQREQLIAYLTDIILVSQAANAAKLADDPDFQRHLAFLRNKMLMGLQLSKQAKDTITPEAEQQLYDDAVKSQAAQEEVHARHILVETEDEAKAILEQIKNGADFADMAKQKSKDPGAADGGDLGYFTHDQMVPEFADVAFKMYPGQMSNPIKTQFGWHIIKVEDKRQKAVPELAAVKDQIDNFLMQRAQRDYIGKLRQTAKVERLDHPATPPPAMPFPAAPK
jgi:peptidyl-prolyl cis-trans isomerase C